eukprot:3251067-Amphidinium_carterae.1
MKAVIGSVGTTLQVSETLCAEAGFHASKVRSVDRDLCKKDTGRIPLDFVVCFTPGEVLFVTTPSTGRRFPSKSVSY